jgi:ABC-2 type transport system ATP-binding protein
VHERARIDEAARLLTRHSEGDAKVEQHTRKITVPVAGGAKLLAEVIRDLDAEGIEIDDIGLRRPTLDDVFISLTGHAAEVAESTDEEEPAETAEKETVK